MKRAMLAMGGLLVLGACARVDDGALSRLTVGATTVEQAKDALGGPTREEVLPDGSHMLTYVESHSTPRVSNYLPGLVYLWGGWDGTSDEAGLMFDPEGRLRFYSWSSKHRNTIKVVGNDLIPAKVLSDPAPVEHAVPDAGKAPPASHSAD
jgi:hypothetical protein